MQLWKNISPEMRIRIKTVKDINFKKKKKNQPPGTLEKGDEYVKNSASFPIPRNFDFLWEDNNDDTFLNFLAVYFFYITAIIEEPKVIELTPF